MCQKLQFGSTGTLQGKVIFLFLNRHSCTPTSMTASVIPPYLPDVTKYITTPSDSISKFSFLIIKKKQHFCLRSPDSSRDREQKEYLERKIFARTSRGSPYDDVSVGDMR